MISSYTRYVPPATTTTPTTTRAVLAAVLIAASFAPWEATSASDVASWVVKTCVVCWRLAMMT